ncbi:MAG: patatin-like phospholipase family protein [Bacteroidia bacterium]|nr:patatin-like phospholipase family protein [Bacteroidia bacterium]
MENTKYIIFNILIISLLSTSCNRYIKPKRENYFPSRKDYVDINPYKSPQGRNAQHPNLAVGVALSGGGSRAYGFSAGVLLGLEALDNGMGSNYLREVDYISAVSGGGFAAGCMLATQHAHLQKYPHKKFLFANYEAYMKECLMKNYAKPVVFGRGNPKTLFGKLDNGDQLERRVDDFICGRKLRKGMGLPLESIRLGDIFIKKEDSLREVIFPHFVANASLTSNARLFTFAPQTLADYQVSGYVHRMKKYHYAEMMDPYEMPLSVGIKSSGTFPGAVMNSTLASKYKGTRYIHLYDGGLADNVGWRAAIDMLKEDSIATKKILLVVDVDMNAYPETFSKRENGGFFLTSLWRTPFSGLDSRRMMRNKEIEEKCAVFGITPIYLDFTALIANSQASPPEKINVRQERKRIIEMINKDQTLNEADLQILYELAVGIPTKYSLGSKELEFLLTIGKEVVKQKADILSSYL